MSRRLTDEEIREHARKVDDFTIAALCDEFEATYAEAGV